MHVPCQKTVGLGFFLGVPSDSVTIDLAAFPARGTIYATGSC